MLQERVSKIEELEQLTLFQEEIHASHTAQPGKEKVKQMNDIYGLKCLELSKEYSQIGLLTKMLLEVYPTESWTKKYLTWKVKNTKCKHLIYQLLPQVRHIKGDGLSLLPTPKTKMRDCPSERERKSPNLEAYMKMYATPQSRDYRTGQLERWKNPKRSRNLNDQMGGKLNPEFVEWVMGFPTGWTDLNV